MGLNVENRNEWPGTRINYPIRIVRDLERMECMEEYLKKRFDK